MSEQVVTPAVETHVTPAAPAAAPVTESPATTPDAVQGQDKLSQTSAPTEPVAPEKYDLKLSEGSKLPAARLAEIEKEAREGKLSQDQAAKIVAREEAAVKQSFEAEQADYQARAAEWTNTIKNDSELGGANSARSAELAHRAVERFASPELKEILKTTQLGNHPELVRTFKRVGEAMANDSFVAPGAQSSPPQQTAAQRMFNKSV